MTFDVRFSTEAEDNIREIRDWIAKQSRDGALRWLDALGQAKIQLATRANTLAIAPEADAFDEELRQVHFKTRHGNTYRALYVIRGSVVHVVSVRGAGQDLIRPGDIEIPKR